MTYMLCRNKVSSFERWREVFRSHEEAHREAGLILEYVWRDADDPNTVRFLFRVEDIEKVMAFMSTPEAADAANRAGVLDGEYHFIESADGYR